MTRKLLNSHLFLLAVFSRFSLYFFSTSLEIIFHKLRQKQPAENAKHDITAHKYGLPIFKPTVKTVTTGSSSISLIFCKSRMENSPARNFRLPSRCRADNRKDDNCFQVKDMKTLSRVSVNTFQQLKSMHNCFREHKTL